TGAGKTWMEPPGLRAGGTPPARHPVSTGEATGVATSGPTSPLTPKGPLRQGRRILRARCAGRPLAPPRQKLSVRRAPTRAPHPCGQGAHARLGEGGAAHVLALQPVPHHPLRHHEPPRHL